jgi:glycosyltransferase involved in cell wall biosynthesis
MLVTSHYESFGLAMLEAMSYGVSVVAPEVGGIPEVVRHGREGFIYAPGDLPAAAGAILSLLRRPARLRAMAGEAATRSRDFAREAVLPRYESLYRRVLSKEAAHG